MSATIINPPGTNMSEKAAALLAHDLTKDQADDWTYEARATGPGSRWFNVIAFDENGTEIGPI